MSTGEASLGGPAGPMSTGLAGDGHGAWLDLAPHPIRRWVARLFDLYVTTGLLFAALATPGVAFRSGAARFVPLGIAGAAYLLMPARGLVSALLNAVLLSRTSTTPGSAASGSCARTARR